MTDRGLAQQLLNQLPEGHEALRSSDAELSAALIRALDEARAAFPSFGLADSAFVTYLAPRLPKDRPLEVSVSQLRTTDLYLCCACLSGIAPAIDLFRERYVPQTREALLRMETASFQVEDVQQMVCQRLLVPSAAGDEAKLASYAGTGDLSSWLRVMAVRTALDLLRREKSTQELTDHSLADAVSPEEDQELQYLKRLYRNEFNAAFQQALGELVPRERNILRHQFLDGLTLDQIADVYSVHRATIARWNNRLREKLLVLTRKALLDRLHTSSNEFESIMRLIQSQLDVSIRRHLDPDRE